LRCFESAKVNSPLFPASGDASIDLLRTDVVVEAIYDEREGRDEGVEVDGSMTQDVRGDMCQPPEALIARLA